MLDKPRLAAGLTFAAFALICLAAVARFAPDATGSMIGSAAAHDLRTAGPAAMRAPAEMPWGTIAARLSAGN